MGNSITDNWALMDSVFFAEHRFVGRGISGQTSAEMLVRFRQDVIGLSPEAVVIMAGTNDLAQNNGYIALENILGNIASMCELAKLHKIRPILCSVLPAYRFGWRQEVPAADRIIELNGIRAVRPGKRHLLCRLPLRPEGRTERPAGEMQRRRRTPIRSATKSWKRSFCPLSTKNRQKKSPSVPAARKSIALGPDNRSQIHRPMTTRYIETPRLILRDWQDSDLLRSPK